MSAPDPLPTTTNASRFLVTGCGRSGTHAAAVLLRTLLGAGVAHEGLASRGVVSWTLAPFAGGGARTGAGGCVGARWGESAVSEMSGCGALGDGVGATGGGAAGGGGGGGGELSKGFGGAPL